MAFWNKKKEAEPETLEVKHELEVRYPEFAKVLDDIGNGNHELCAGYLFYIATKIHSTDDTYWLRHEEELDLMLSISGADNKGLLKAITTFVGISIKEGDVTVKRRT
jgi:hypothetical protein